MKKKKLDLVLIKQFLIYRLLLDEINNVLVQQVLHMLGI